MAAKPHGQALIELRDRIDVAGVYTRSADGRQAFGADFGVPVVDDLKVLLDDPTVQAVLILTPPNARLDIVRAAAQAGKHILCEKPLERSASAAAQIVDICAQAKVHLGVVFQHRYRPAAQELASLLASGTLGPIHAVRVEVPWWRDQAYYDEPGRGSFARDGGGVLISQAIHTLDLMLSLTGPVTEVQAMATTTRFHQMESEDFVTAGMQFANGASGSLFATTAAFPGAAEIIRLECAHGSVQLQSGELQIHWQNGQSETRGATAATGGGADPMAFPCDRHRDLIAAFADAIENGRPPTPSGENALSVQRLISALIRSSNTKACVAVGKDA